MKFCFAYRIAILAAGIFLAACSSLVPPEAAVTPAPSEPPAATETNPTAASPTDISPTTPTSPTTTVIPTTTPAAPTTEAATPAAPTESPFPGTPITFDRLRLVVPAGVAAGGSGALVPEATGESVAPWDVAPEHILLTLDGYALPSKMFQPQIFVYPAEAYARLQERGTAAQSLERLRAVIAQPAMVDVNALPQVPFFNVTQALAAQVQVIPFQNGQGVRVVTQYAMARSIINNQELIYHFEGLTGDGQFYVIAILPVTAPGLPEDGQPGSPLPPGGLAVPDFNDLNANWMGYYGEARQMLQNLAPAAYTPDLAHLDALIASLTIAP